MKSFEFAETPPELKKGTVLGYVVKKDGKREKRTPVTLGELKETISDFELRKAFGKLDGKFALNSGKYDPDEYMAEEIERHGNDIYEVVVQAAFYRQELTTVNSRK